MSSQRTSNVRHMRRPARGYMILVAIAAVPVLAITTACSSGTTVSGSGSGSGSTYRVGVITAETGPLAGAGKAFLSGVDVALDQINKDGVIGGGKKIELVKKESAEDPARSASVAAQLASDQSILGTVCCILSPVAGAVKPVVIGAKMPTIIYGATAVGLAQPPYVIRTTTMPQVANTAISKFVAKEKALKTVAYVVMTDNAGIVSQGESFKKGFDEAGVKDLGQVGIVGKQTNFTSSAATVMQKNADAIVVSATQSEAVGMIAALHDKGYKGQIVTGETVLGPGVFKSNPDALENAPFPVYFLPTETTPAGTAFATAYKTKYGTDPDDFAAQGYNALYVMAIGLKAAGDKPTRASLVKALSGLTSVPDTIYGTVTFDGGQLSASAGVKFVHYSKPDGVIVPWTGS